MQPVGLANTRISTGHAQIKVSPITALGSFQVQPALGVVALDGHVPKHTWWVNMP